MANTIPQPTKDFAHSLFRLIREGYDGIKVSQNHEGDHVQIKVDMGDGRVFSVTVGESK